MEGDLALVVDFAAADERRRWTVTSASAVQGELDELEREEFFRLKKVQDKKERDQKQRKEAAAKEAAAKKATYGVQAGGAGPEAVSASVLETHDEDELF